VLRLLAIILTVVNVGLGLLVASTRGGAFNMVGLPGPLPFYGDFLGLFLVASGLGFVPAIRTPNTYRFYLWVMGVGVKLIVASLLLRVWFAGIAPAILFAGAIGEAALGGLTMWALLRPASAAQR
jgi:hypothetical protein